MSSHFPRGAQWHVVSLTPITHGYCSCKRIVNFILRVIQSGIHEHVDLVYQDWMLRLFGVADFAEKHALNTRLYYNRADRIRVDLMQILNYTIRSADVARK